MADHGFYLGEHGFIGKVWIRNRRYQSLPLYPEVSRIPMIVRYPGCAAGSRIDAFAQPVDMMPTILDFLGIATPKTAQGHSLSRILQGRPDADAKTFAVSSPTLSHKKLKTPISTDRSSITDGKWMLVYGAQHDESAAPAAEKTAVDSQVRTLTQMGDLPAPELYDLDDDPGCGKNVYPEHLDMLSLYRA